MLEHKLSKFDLMSGNEIYIEGVGRIRQPTLKEIKDVGFENYYNKLSLITVDMSQLIELFGLQEKDMPEDIVPFDIFSISEDSAAFLLDSLQFFFIDKLEFAMKHRAFISILDFPKTNRKVDIEVNIGKIDRTNFQMVRDVILEMSGFTVDETKDARPKNETAKRILEKLAQGRAKMESSKKNVKDTESHALWNIIGAVAACSTTYNLNNIWDLTVWQLYDQFARINNQFYLNIMAMRWCAWGEDQFDCTPWYSEPKG